MPHIHGGFEDIREEVDGHPMRNLFAYVVPYWKRLVPAMLASLVMRLARLVPALAVAATIDRVIDAPGKPQLLAQVGLITSETIPAGMTAGRINLLYTLALIAGGAYVVQAISQFASRYLFQSTAQEIQNDLRSDTYDHMQHLSMDFFNRHQTGGMMAILNSDINRLEDFFNSEIRQIIRAIVLFGVVGAVMLYYAPELALIALAPMPVIAVVTARFMVWIEPRYKRIRELVAQLNTRFSNNLGGVAVIKAFDRYDIERERVEDQSDAYRDEKVGVIRIRKAFFSSLRLLIGAVFLLVLVGGGLGVIGTGITVGPVTLANGMTVGTFTLFFMFLRRLDGPMTRLGKTANKYQKAKSSAERIFGVLGHDPTITSPADAVDPTPVAGSVMLEDITFSYDNQDDRVLDGIELNVPAGTTVGLAGTSGSGKSTLLKLLPRFHDTDEGTVRIDGIDVRECDLQALRDEIGVVEQDPYMFSGTIRENIAYGDKDTFAELYASSESGCSEAAERRLREAARAAGAHEFITDLPEGYDTQVGERGVKLSGGQRQRVAISRTLFNDPSIIILDEATSDVDTETEEVIQENLDRLCEDRTAFVIAHRLSTIRDADQIVVLDDGGIIESGSHEMLLDNGGTYADLWTSQSDMTSGQASALSS
ncbi:ABC transporter ATP-binding protein [Halococcus sp. PRR34]|uniref:ABC transporter ATP-binding protein n=1 Tax=Halococcus sp. PRR34 TaxID=3020830 RepID=UPI00236305DC|nr:ABC transporter ATP-binding protein [Halococcus sp. PRR34]